MHKQNEAADVTAAAASCWTHRWTSGVRDDRPPKLAAKVLISICLRDDEPSAFWSSM